MENKMGFLRDIKSKDGNVIFDLVLNNEELENTSLQLGEYVNIKTTYGSNTRNFLGRVENVYYQPIEISDYARSLALAKINDKVYDIDEHAKRSMNFMNYEIAFLGEFNDKKDRFYPSTREVPHLFNIEVYKFDDEGLKQVINLSINEDKENQSNQFGIGYLRYGSNENNQKKNVIKNIDINNFIKKRTANFGKTGFGKSNENKVIITLLAQNNPNLSMLIFDINGEYALQESGSTSKGLIDTFKELGIKNRIVFYTNREGMYTNEYCMIKPYKINFYKNPELAISIVYEKRILEDGNIPQYIESIYADLDGIKAIPNRLAMIKASLCKAGLKCSEEEKILYANKHFSIKDLVKEIENKTKNKKVNEDDEDGNIKGSSTTKLFKQYYNIFSFLNGIHSEKAENDLFQNIKQDLQNNKIVILDIPSLRSFSNLISNKIAGEVFKQEQELFMQDKCYNTIFLIEEAHNLLSDKNSVWNRIAKEGRKYGIGMIYSTQSPSSIPNDIIGQTENFFVKHLSSEKDISDLVKAKSQFREPISKFILEEPVIGLSYIYMEPYQAFAVPVQIKELKDIVEDLKKV